MRIETKEALDLDPAAPILPQVCALLRKAVIQGELAAGDRVSETEIARSGGVSRQPVREALIRLSGKGPAKIRAQRGTILPRIDYAAVLDAWFLRDAIVDRIAAGDTAGANGEIRMHLCSIPTDLPEIIAARPQVFHRPDGSSPTGQCANSSQHKGGDIQ